MNTAQSISFCRNQALAALPCSGIGCDESKAREGGIELAAGSGSYRIVAAAPESKLIQQHKGTGQDKQ